MSIDAGSTYESGAGVYHRAIHVLGSNGTDYSAAATNDTLIHLAGGANGISNTTASGGISATIKFFNLPSTSKNKHVSFEGIYAGAAAAIFTTTIGIAAGVSSNLTNNDVTALKFAMSAGNIASGSFYLYGIKKS
jgi:hypothetical protein